MTDLHYKDIIQYFVMQGTVALIATILYKQPLFIGERHSDKD